MDGRSFDDLTRKLAKAASRRSMLKGLLGGAGAMAAGTVVVERASAQCLGGGVSCLPASCTCASDCCSGACSGSGASRICTTPPTTTTTLPPCVEPTPNRCGATCEECCIDDHCAVGSVCCGNVCVVGDCCSTDTCGEELVCVDNTCTDLCASVACDDCETCDWQTGLCETECESGQVCCDDTCETGDCCETSECGTNLVCQGFTCTDRCAQVICVACHTCNWQTGLCEPNCTTGQVCCENTCSVGNCCDDEECGTGSLCCFGFCAEGNCCSDGDCVTGEVCCENSCESGECCSDLACTEADGGTCVDRACVYPTTTTPEPTTTTEQPTTTTPATGPFCREEGETCGPGVGNECCEGFTCVEGAGPGAASGCVPTATTTTPAPTTTTPQTGPFCREQGETCGPGVGNECCAGFTCVEGAGPGAASGCVPIIIGDDDDDDDSSCAEKHEVCYDTDDCCADLVCRNGECKEKRRRRRCRRKDDHCKVDDDCCFGMRCKHGKCQKKRHFAKPPQTTVDSGKGGTESVHTLPSTGFNDGADDGASMIGITLAGGAAAVLAAKLLRDQQPEEEDQDV